ncbi:hypothetical protein Tco_0718518 [Tanacetum coccineum]
MSVEKSDNNSESNCDIGDESDDECEVAAQSHSQGVMDFINDIGDASDEDADNKWQMERFPCSHALAVCRHRGDNPLTIIHTVYTTAMFKQQYLSDFTPLPHVDYWLNSDWNIKANNSKINVSRGRKKSSRIRNEMDIRHPDEPKRCGLCRQTGHNRSRCTNSQPRFNSA